MRRQRAQIAVAVDKIVTAGEFAGFKRLALPHAGLQRIGDDARAFFRLQRANRVHARPPTFTKPALARSRSRCNSASFFHVIGPAQPCDVGVAAQRGGGAGSVEQHGVEVLFGF